jgi:hypothetical protein
MMDGEWQIANCRLQIVITSYKLVVCFMLALTGHSGFWLLVFGF